MLGFNTLLNDTMARYVLPDVSLNINCGDLPRPGYLNFCRRNRTWCAENRQICGEPRDIDGQFLLPSHSFGHDAAFGGGLFGARLVNDMSWDDVLAVVAARDTTPFGDKSEKTSLVADINSGAKVGQCRLNYVYP